MHKKRKRKREGINKKDEQPPKAGEKQGEAGRGLQWESGWAIGWLRLRGWATTRQKMRHRTHTHIAITVIFLTATDPYLCVF